jgi:hypothetical protein
MQPRETHSGASQAEYTQEWVQGEAGGGVKTLNPKSRKPGAGTW